MKANKYTGKKTRILAHVFTLFTKTHINTTFKHKVASKTHSKTQKKNIAEFEFYAGLRQRERIKRGLRRMGISVSTCIVYCRHITVAYTHTY